MPSFLDKAAESDEEIRRTQEKDPADLSGAEEPDWDNPDTWGGSGDDASDSASGNAGDSADENDHQEEPESPEPPKRKAAPTRTPALRRGRPQGPARKAVTARILMSNNRKLTKAVELTGKQPQTIFDEALELYFRRLKIEDPGEPAEDSDAA